MRNPVFSLSILKATVPLLLVVVLSGCSWFQKRELQHFSTRWVPLRDSLNLYLDSLNYLPRQASTYMDMMQQDTLFFRLFKQEDVQQFMLVKKLVANAATELAEKGPAYHTLVSKSDETDLQYQGWIRYLAGKEAAPQKSISELNTTADSLQAQLQALKRDHRRLFDAIRLNFFMHKDLHNNLMKPFWDSLYSQGANPEAITKYPAPQQ